MPRRRDLSPDFFTNEDLVLAERASGGLPLRIAYQGLWCHADREGRFEWRPGRLKLGVLPYDDVDMEAVLMALVQSGHVVRYEADGQAFGWIPTFKKHQQRIHPREAPSRIPPHQDDPGQPPAPPRSTKGEPKSRLGLAKGEPTNGQGEKRCSGPSGPSGPSDTQALQDTHPTPRGREAWSEERLREHLPEHCHANLRRVLTASRAGGPAAADAIARMCGLDPTGIPTGVGMRPCTVEEVAGVIDRLATAKDPAWQQTFANRILEAIRREASRSTPPSAPAASNGRRAEAPTL